MQDLDLNLVLIDFESKRPIEGIRFERISAVPSVGQEICYREGTDDDPLGEKGVKRIFIVKHIRHDLFYWPLTEGRSMQTQSIELFVVESKEI